ncbi:M48 family metallopeptidase, partial [Achromobacter sp. NPDC058515]|uniref:M48 family metallopeptidase n=1 Tax=Achromobacter sp. NPDC058515 TaxID=3346533 RepID=UPI00364F67F1
LRAVSAANSASLKALPALPPSDHDVIRGRLFQAGAAAHRPATLECRADGSLTVHDGETQHTLPPRSLRWSSRIGTTPRRAALPDGSVFETTDNDQVDRLERAQGRHGAGLLHRLEHVRTHWLALAAVAMLVFFVGLRWTIPWLGDTAATFVPHAVEVRIGAGVMDTLDRMAFRPTALPAETRKAIQSVFDDLAAHSDAPAGSLRLAFRSGRRYVGANALALPGGQIVVTDELVKLAGSPDTLAGVLAHEIGHVEHRHGMRRLGRVAGLSAVVMLMTGDVASMTHDIGVFGAGLLDLSYSRGFEREADARGVALTRQAGKDPESLAVLLERLSAHSKDRGEEPSWLSSHPPTEERVERIRQAR